MQLGLASLRLWFTQDVQLSNTAQFWQQNNQNAKYNLKQTLEIGVFFLLLWHLQQTLNRSLEIISYVENQNSYSEPECSF